MNRRSQHYAFPYTAAGTQIAEPPAGPTNLPHVLTVSTHGRSAKMHVLVSEGPNLAGPTLTRIQMLDTHMNERMSMHVCWDLAQIHWTSNNVPQRPAQGLAT